ncbi:hypothetical protein BN1708_007437 [Verticillium longisporum]|uniref:Uncharacterized protein n=1 Tax=Verticillium longisporum TaxID=100787 RepID=A0A0G4MTU2_VERLO|nr:hypothetical protein BN1708_007437 [Verticillium longisporum]
MTRDATTRRLQHPRRIAPAAPVPSPVPNNSPGNSPLVRLKGVPEPPQHSDLRAGARRRRRRAKHPRQPDEQVDDGLSRAVQLDARQQVEQPGDDLEAEGVAAAEGAVLVEGAAGEEGVLEELEDEARLVAGRDVGEEGALAGEEGGRCAGGAAAAGGAQGEGFDVAHDEGEGRLEAGDEEGCGDVVEVGGVVCEEGRQVEDGAAACVGGVAGAGQQGEEVVAIEQGAFAGVEDDGAAGLEVGIREPESGLGRDEMRGELAAMGVTGVLVRDGEGMSGVVVLGVAVIINVDGRVAVFEVVTADLKSGIGMVGVQGVLRGQICVVPTHIDVLIDKLQEA